jgi:hypothetical protein
MLACYNLRAHAAFPDKRSHEFLPLSNRQQMQKNPWACSEPASACKSAGQRFHPELASSRRGSSSWARKHLLIAARWTSEFYFGKVTGGPSLTRLITIHVSPSMCPAVLDGFRLKTILADGHSHHIGAVETERLLGLDPVASISPRTFCAVFILWFPATFVALRDLGKQDLPAAHSLRSNQPGTWNNSLERIFRSKLARRVVTETKQSNPLSTT